MYGMGWDGMGARDGDKFLIFQFGYAEAKRQRQRQGRMQNAQFRMQKREQRHQRQPLADKRMPGRGGDSLKNCARP